MNRKKFLAYSAAVLGGAVITGNGCVLPFAGGSGKKVSPIGVQLYTLRSLLENDFEGTIERVAEIGYQEVEFAGYYDRTPRDIRNLLNRVGLTSPATHYSLEATRQNLDHIVESANIIGHEFILIPSLPRSERGSLDFYKRISGYFNEVGEKCQAAGLQFGYHNHAFEFEVIDGETPYDILLEYTDPELVTMELDLFWIVRGGRDPLEYFDRYPGRFKLCHVKDMDADDNMVDVGSGMIDFAAIFAKSEQAGLQHYFVEHDNPGSPIESITNSYNYLNRLRV